LLIPEGMAYAGIEGVPPQVGLYAAMLGMFVYAIFGTSRQLAVTSTSSSAVMLAPLVAPITLPNGILFFANANRVHSRLRELVKATGPSLRAVIINPEASPAIDVTCLEMLDRLQGELRELGIDFYFARVADPVRDLFKRSGFVEELEGRLFRGVDSAVNAHLSATRGISPPSELGLVVEHG
jgi:MFS superfamily sulfate permease-like transporter